VSQQLAALERDVGRGLLEPNGRSVRLTAAARVLLEHADALFAQLERLEGDLAASGGEARGEIRVVGFPTALAGLVAPAARTLRAEAPGVTLRILELETPEAAAALTRRDAELMLGMECSAAPQAGDGRWHREELIGDTLDAVLPVGHPLAGRARIGLEELAREQWIAPPVGWSCDEVFHAGCRAAGFSPRIAHRAGDWQATMGLVSAELGISLVPRLAQTTPPPGVVVIPLAGVAPKRHVFAACRAGAEAAPAMRALLDALGHAARTPARVVAAA
jgi:DNA-binding transcriptional LysR family regulator